MLSDASYNQMSQVQFMEEQTKFHPEEVSSMVLTKTMETNEAYLRNKMNDAVVTMSAHFSDLQRQATKNTRSTSGLNVSRVVNEPNTAVITYELDKKRRWQTQHVDLRRGWRHFLTFLP